MYSRLLTDLFIKYTAITSQSKYEVQTLPTTTGQMELAKILEQDLNKLGIKNTELQDNAILIAKIPATKTTAPSIAFMAHIDTVNIGVSPDVHAQVVSFDGTDILLNKEKNITLKVSDHPEILSFKGEDIIVTDGTSVLGADDKAGVTIMMGLAHYLTENAIEHGDIYLVFVPDEEVGLRGAYALDLDKIPVRYAYTIDGGPLGEFGYETFNGAGVSINIKGVSVHPGSAKGILVNPILVAHDIIAKLDRQDTPEHSEGKEGFFLITDISGGASEASLKMIIRDFDLDKFNKRKEHITKIVSAVQKMHPTAIIELTITDSYANIANALSEDRSAVDLVLNAMNQLNITPNILAIRGGTDGAVLSAKGLMTPNICTGAYKIHSVFEFLPISEFTKSFEIVVETVRLSAQL